MSEKIEMPMALKLIISILILIGSLGIGIMMHDSRINIYSFALIIIAVGLICRLNIFRVSLLVLIWLLFFVVVVIFLFFLVLFFLVLGVPGIRSGSISFTSYGGDSTFSIYEYLLISITYLGIASVLYWMQNVLNRDDVRKIFKVKINVENAHAEYPELSKHEEYPTEIADLNKL